MISAFTPTYPPILRARDASQHGLHRVALGVRVKRGELIHLARGVYAPLESLDDPLYPYAELSLRAPRAVVCLLSALHLHGLTDEGPHGIWAAFPRQQRAPTTMSVPLTVIHLSPQQHAPGIEVREILGQRVNVYSPARTVVDCFRMRSRVGTVRAVAALKDTLAARAATIGQIQAMAEKLRMATVMRPYLEAVQ